jgi:YesN/AraC family two-component response regulator
VNKTRILFADDEPIIRMTLPAILEQEGFEITTAETVPEALKLMNDKKFDVLIADLNIGEKSDGFTLITAMRRVQPQAVNLILTGYPEFETALQAIRSQVDDYLTKPTDIKRLVATIKERSNQPRRIAPKQTKRVSNLLRENGDQIVEEWFEEVSRNSDLSSIHLGKKDRLNDIRQIIEELATRIETNRNVMGGQMTDAANKHGQKRFEQGYRPPLIAIEARLLHIVMSRIIQTHLLSLDMSNFVSDMMLIGEAFHEQFEESLRAFDEHARYLRTG